MKKHPKIVIGNCVKFDPHAHMKFYGRCMSSKIVTGVITYINEPHRWFRVEYGNPVQRIAFKFDDVGESVHFVGKR